MDHDLAMEVYEALGKSSACWSMPGLAGEFDSARVEQIGKELIARLDSHYSADLAPYRIIADTIRQHVDTPDMQSLVDVQMLCLAEEAGEAIKAWRRFTNRARVSEDLDHVLEELADVIIVARLTFLMLEADEREAIRKKLITIVERGGR